MKAQRSGPICGKEANRQETDNESTVGVSVCSSAKLCGWSHAGS